MTYFLSGALHWMKQPFIIKVIFIKSGCRLSSKHFPTLPQIKIENLSTIVLEKIIFPSACYYWKGTISLREVEQKFSHGGKNGYRDSYLDSVLRYFKDSDCMQYYKFLLEQFEYKPVKDLATAT